jgi:hypothetical protein
LLCSLRALSLKVAKRADSRTTWWCAAHRRPYRSQRWCRTRDPPCEVEAALRRHRRGHQGNEAESDGGEPAAFHHLGCRLGLLATARVWAVGADVPTSTCQGRGGSLLYASASPLGKESRVPGDHATNQQQTSYLTCICNG